MISGTYAGQSGDLQLLLRIDVDGARPLNIVSGDIFRLAYGASSYVDSFLIPTVQSSQSAQGVELRGVGASAYSGTPYSVALAVPSVQPTGIPEQAAALVSAPRLGQFSFICNYLSPAFRRVAVNSAYQESSVILTNYETWSDSDRPADLPNKTLNLLSAYAEAGIQIYEDLPPVMLQVGEGNPNDTWSDAELHAALQWHFATFSNLPQWRLFVMFVHSHEEPGYIGLMFDTHDSHQRRGCALFTKNTYLTNGTPEQNGRASVWATVHEAGHCFNLLHSFAKGANVASQPDALSWMNYPYSYDALPGKQQGDFWRSFEFQFADEELRHLRHRELPFVIMGGTPLEVGGEAVLPKGYGETEEEKRRRAWLRIEAKPIFEFGEPVYIEASVRPPAAGQDKVVENLDPAQHRLRIWITKPSGAIVEYRAPVIGDVILRTREVTASSRPYYEAIYIGYGRDGLYFAEPGKYVVRASYLGCDGVEAVSNSVSLEVLSAPAGEEQAFANNLLGYEQGLIFYFGGSDFLARGNSYLQEQLLRQPNGATARQIHRCFGLNAAKPFKFVTPDNKIRVRGASDATAGRHLAACLHLSATTGVSPLGNILFREAAETLARLRVASGERDRAEALVKNVGSYFAAQGIRADVLQSISESINSTIAGGSGPSSEDAENRAEPDEPDPSAKRRSVKRPPRSE